MNETPWIQLFSGTKLELLHPKKSDIHLTDIAHSLSMLARFNGHLMRHYSVATHSLHVADIIKRKTGKNRLALIGLYHEAGEMACADVSRPLKKILPQYSAVEKNVMMCAYESIGVTSEEVHESEEIVKEADNIALVTEASQLLAHPPIDNWIAHYAVEPETQPLVNETPIQAYNRFLAAFARYSSR